MSVRSRWVLTGFSTALWAAWLFLVCTGASPDHLSVTIERIAEPVCRLAAVVVTLSTVLVWSISPFIATAKVYMRIGEMEERARQQADACDCQERRVMGATVIPIRPIRQRTFSDS